MEHPNGYQDTLRAMAEATGLTALERVQLLTAGYTPDQVGEIDELKRQKTQERVENALQERAMRRELGDEGYESMIREIAVAEADRRSGNRHHRRSMMREARRAA